MFFIKTGTTVLAPIKISSATLRRAVGENPFLRLKRVIRVVWIIMDRVAWILSTNGLYILPHLFHMRIVLTIISCCYNK